MNNEMIRVPRGTLQKWLDDIGPSRHVTQYASLRRDELRALLDAAEPLGSTQAELVGYVIPGNMPAQSGYTKTLNPIAEGKYTFPLYSGQPAPAAVVLPEFEPAFEEWWESDGQYCRSGGGSYEKIFAYRAYEAALADVTRLNTK